MTEIQLQAKIFQFTWNEYPETRGLFFHVPNGGSRNKIEGMQLKASGVIPGIPDMILLHKGSAYGFELKKQDGKVSEAQVKVHKTWQDNGTPVYVIRSFEEFLPIWEEIIK